MGRRVLCEDPSAPASRHLQFAVRTDAVSGFVISLIILGAINLADEWRIKPIIPEINDYESKLEG